MLEIEIEISSVYKHCYQIELNFLGIAHEDSTIGRFARGKISFFSFLIQTFNQAHHDESEPLHTCP